MAKFFDECRIPASFGLAKKFGETDPRSQSYQISVFFSLILIGEQEMIALILSYKHIE